MNGKPSHYASHLEITVAVALRTGMIWPGSKVLELGCGDFSTPVLAAIANVQARPMTVISSDSSWLVRYKYLQNPRFATKLITFDHWPRIDFDSDIGMVLIDNEQRVKERMKLANRLCQLAKVVVLHDANVVFNSDGICHTLRRKYKYCHLHINKWPHTAALSNFVDVREWFENDSRLGQNESQTDLSTSFEKLWVTGGNETTCGIGSTLAATTRLRRWLPKIFVEFGIKSVNDAGCGDLNWIRELDLGSIDYLGIDIVEFDEWKSLRNQSGFRLEQKDFTKCKLGDADLTICRDALIHLPNVLVVNSLSNFKRSAKYLLSTSFEDANNANRDIRPGGFARIDLTKEPFSLGKPIKSIAEKHHRGKYLGFWHLR